MSRPVALVLSQIFPPRVGGSGQWLNEIYRRQDPGRTVLIVGEHPESQAFDAASGLRIERADLACAEWTLMTGAGRAYFARMFALVRRARRRHGADAIHCARVMPEGVVGWAASRLLGLKLVCYVHGEDVELAWRSRESRWLVRRVLARAARLVCNSDNTRALLTDVWGVDPKRIAVLHPGVDTDLFRPADEVEALRRRLGWEGRRVILTVSRLERRKGHDRLIEALPRIAERVPDVLYAIVGDGPERARLEAEAVRLGVAERVRFHGECGFEELVERYRACHAFALPNRRVGTSIEGFGIVLLEAQACGRPVLAGDSGGTAETMVPGRTGLIVDCTDSANLVEPLTELLLDEAMRERMGRAGRELMLERFAWNGLAERAAHAVFAERR